MNQLYNPDATLNDETNLCYPEPFFVGHRIITPITKEPVIIRGVHRLDEPLERRGYVNRWQLLISKKGEPQKMIYDGTLEMDFTATCTLGQYGDASFQVRGRTIEEAHDNALLQARRFAFKDAGLASVTGVMVGKVMVYA